MAKKDEAATRLVKLSKLIPLAKELHEKLGAVIEELGAVGGGGAGIAAQLKIAEQAFDHVWGQRYAGGEDGRYIWAKMRDVPQMKRLIKGLGIEELLNRMARYVANEDQFIVRARHPFGLFVSGINSYVGARTAPQDLELKAPTVSDCWHTPSCLSDQEHTDRKMRELRA